MAMKICYNCGEKMITLTQKCPKCGIVPEKSKSPVLIGIIVTAVLFLIAVAGLILF